jgi:two-component system, cell cycle sensor histidine kinase and response regulator CckA
MPGKRILVVDDQDLILQSIKMMLTHVGHAVETATSGPEALVKIETGQFDLVITDWRMPGMSGEELAHEIKQKQTRLPIILLTGYLPESQSPAIDLVLRKPFSTAEIQGAVDTLTS